MCKQKNWTLREDERDNPHSVKRDDNSVYVIEIFDSSDNLKHSSKNKVATKVDGRCVCSLEILKKEFGPKYNWLQLVEETR